jgi:hypothetical protein
MGLGAAQAIGMSLPSGCRIASHGGELAWLANKSAGQARGCDAGLVLSLWRTALAMDAALKAKLDEARKRLNSKQAEINANRRHSDQVFREWARGEQNVAIEQRDHFRISLSENEREQIENRVQELLNDYPQLSAVAVRPPNTTATTPSIPDEALEEYYFLNDLVG